MNHPFLTFVLRCTRRSFGLQRSLSTLRKQTDNDYQILCLIDEKGRGIRWANKNLCYTNQYVKGKYVYLSEDDDEFQHIDFIKDLKDIVFLNSPDVIFVRSYIGCNNQCEEIERNIYPLEKTWEKEPQPACIGTPCFVVTNEIYQKYIKHYNKVRGADINFISHIYNTKGLKIYWWNKIVNKSYRMDNRKDKEDVDFEKILDEFNIPIEDRIYGEDREF